MACSYPKYPFLILQYAAYDAGEEAWNLVLSALRYVPLDFAYMKDIVVGSV